MTKVNRSPVIVALDFADMRSCSALVDQLNPALCRLKVGKELFTRFGKAQVDELQKRGFDIFLDLKFHDIPNTVAAAVAAAADMGVWMVNVHASGGRAMLTAAADTLSHRAQRPLLTAVTVLTSMNASELAEVGVSGSAEDQVARLARLSADCGLDGVVCSAQEISLVKTVCGVQFLTVTPGIRPAGSDVGDQKRIMTPPEAMQLGVDFMVIGRPITQASDPVKALQSINASIGFVAAE